MRLVLCKSWFNDLTELIRSIECEVDNLTPIDEDLSRLSEGIITINIDYPNNRKVSVEITLDGLIMTVHMNGFQDKLTIDITQFGITDYMKLTDVDRLEICSLLAMINNIENTSNEDFCKQLMNDFIINDMV